MSKITGGIIPIATVVVAAVGWPTLLTACVAGINGLAAILTGVVALKQLKRRRP